MSKVLTITDAATLEALCDLLGEADAAVEPGSALEHVIDTADLPTYGGDVPGDTHGIYSWDADSVLVHDTVVFGDATHRCGNWQVIPRDDW